MRMQMGVRYQVSSVKYQVLRSTFGRSRFGCLLERMLEAAVEGFGLFGLRIYLVEYSLVNIANVESCIEE